MILSNNNNNAPQPASGSPHTERVASQRTEGEGERSSTTSSAPHPTTAPELDPSSVAAIQSQTPNTNTMQLEIPSGYDINAPPVPAAQTDHQTHNTNTMQLEIPSSYDIDAPPVPPPQTAAMYEDMENAIKGTPKDDAPPLQDVQIAAFCDEAETGKKGMKEKPETIEQGETPMPTIPPSLEVNHLPPPALSTHSGPASPPATRRENSQTPSRRGQRQAAAVIQWLTSPNDEEVSSPSVPMFHEVEATLAPNEPVYDGVPIPNNVEAPRPWWKRYQRYILGGVGLSIGAAVALGVSLSPNNSTNDEGSEESVVFRDVFFVLSNPPSQASLPSQVPTLRPTVKPSHSFAPSLIPSLHPTNEPSQSFAPSSSLWPSQSFAPTEIPSMWPSFQPSSSLFPSTYLSSLVWEQQGQTLVGDAVEDESGSSVALSANGNALAIGSPGYYDNDDRPGYVKVYHREDTGSSWELLHTFFGSVNGDQFGTSVSFSEDGKTLAVGAPGYWGKGDRAGYVRVYYTEGDSSGLGWQQLGQDINGEAIGDLSGWSLSLSANSKILAIGAISNAGSNGIYSGHVRVYGLDVDDTAPIWKQLGQDIDGEEEFESAGWSLSLSADGKTLAIAAPMNVENGHNSGQARVYYMEEVDEGFIWKQLGQDIHGEAAGDYSGTSVSLSADGKTLAVGGDDNDGNGENSGHVRVYHMEGNGSGLSWIQLGQDIDGEAAGDKTGTLVSLSADGRILAIGARLNGDNGSNSGHVRIYHIDGEGTARTWKQNGQDIDGAAAGDESGFSVSLSADGMTVAIGSIGNDDNGYNSGHVRVFNFGKPDVGI